MRWNECAGPTRATRRPSLLPVRQAQKAWVDAQTRGVLATILLLLSPPLEASRTPTVP